MPRVSENDPLRVRPHRRKVQESEGDASSDVRAALRALVADERYRRGDPDFRAYVRRQHERVFNDPRGETLGLTVGPPKIHTTELEPFERSRERRLRLAQAGKAKGDAVSRRPWNGGSEDRKEGLVGHPLKPAALRVTQAIVQPNEASTTDSSEQDTPEAHRIFGRGPDSGRLRGNDRTLAAVDAMIARARREGLDLSAEYLQRYRDGTGGTDYWSWDRLTSYEAAREADARIHDYFEEWFIGEREDKAVGAPFLDLADGQSMTMGALGTDSPVRWTADWGLPVLSMAKSTLDPSPDTEDMQKRLDFGYALGEAAIRSYGRITFIRSGDEIHVEGVVDFRFDEIYDYESGIMAYFASRTTADAPTIGNNAMRHLAETGPARVFRTGARHLRRVEGVIALEAGEPDAERSWFVWKDVTPTGDPL